MRRRTYERYWIVEGRDSTHPRFFAAAFPMHHYSDEQMSALLQALAAKSSLSYQEIAGALKRRNLRNSLLDVQKLAVRDGVVLACGASLEWTAQVVARDDQRLAELIN